MRARHVTSEVEYNSSLRVRFWARFLPSVERVSGVTNSYLPFPLSLSSSSSDSKASMKRERKDPMVLHFQRGRRHHHRCLIPANSTVSGLCAAALIFLFLLSFLSPTPLLRPSLPSSRRLPPLLVLSISLSIYIYIDLFICVILRV